MNTPTHSKPASRIWYLDLLRIVATFGIVVLHASPLSPEEVDVSTIQWRIPITFSILFRWSVPVFLMISGSLFLSPERKISAMQLYKKSISRLLISFFAWSGLYALTHCILYGKGKWTFLNQFFRGHYHMWFIFAIAALYMLTPLLRKMTASKEATQYFLALGFVFSFLIPRLLSFALLFPFPHADVLQSALSAFTQSNPLPNVHAAYYYVLGHYLHTYPPRGRRRLYVLGLIGYALTVELTIRYSHHLGEASGYFYDMSSLTILAMAIAVFLFFKHTFSEFNVSERLKRILLHLSVCSYGIYLVHPFLIERLQISLSGTPVALLIGTPLLALVIYALSLLISSILNNIPILKKYIV